MTALAFTIPVTPRGWARARKNGNRFFKDKRTADFEHMVGISAMRAMRGLPLFSGPLELTVTSVLPIPPSWTRKRRDAALAGELHPTGKPDWDNLGKGVSDALNGIVWIDDTQVVDGRSIKRYGAEPSVIVEVKQFQPQSTAGPGGKTVRPSEDVLERSTAGG